MPTAKEAQMDDDRFVVAGCPECGDRAYHAAADVERGLRCSNCETPLVALMEVTLDEIAPS